MNTGGGPTAAEPNDSDARLARGHSAVRLGPEHNMTRTRDPWAGPGRTSSLRAPPRWVAEAEAEAEAELELGWLTCHAHGNQPLMADMRAAGTVQVQKAAVAPTSTPITVCGNRCELAVGSAVTVTDLE